MSDATRQISPVSTFGQIVLLIITVATVSSAQEISAEVASTTGSEQYITGGITAAEWKQSLLSAETFKMPAALGKTLAVLPSKVDNSRFAAFRPIFNQRGASCAQASGIGYVYTYEVNYARGLSSQVAANQYPYDYTYNFLNEGDSLMGSTTTQGWSIVKANGVPNCVDYGGFGLGKFTQWISGYTPYHNGMQNKLKSYFYLSVRTAADIDKVKQWLYDHAAGTSQGGLLVLSADIDGQKLVSLPSGTPDAGRKVITAFGTSGGHAMTVSGYNDSIRYDYNKDGKYTNTIDLNADNVIDVRDWEIGGVIMVNSWGNKWADSGRAYIMYKVLADAETSGGIYSNQLIGITLDAQTVAKPSLVCKVTMSHATRENIRLRIGYSTTTSSTKASTSKTFGSAFNYVGGQFPVLGISSAPIEAAFDISEYSSATLSKSAAFFLTIDSDGGSGKVHSFSLFDYSVSPAVEYRCIDTGVTIITGTTTLKLIKQAPSTSPTSVLNIASESSYRDMFTISARTINVTHNNANDIKIYKMDGSVVMAPVSSSNHLSTIDISDLSPNNYILRAGALTKQFTICK